MTEAEIINAFKYKFHIEVLFDGIWYEAVIKELLVPFASDGYALDRIDVFLLRGGYSYSKVEMVTIRKSEFPDHLRVQKAKP
jgi:hypothetical protein